MADLQLEDGNWLQLRKEIPEALARYKLNEHERAVLDMVIRLSYGSKTNEEDGRYCFYNSKREFAAACGIYPNGLIAAWENLINYRILFIDEIHKVIVLNKDYDTWLAPIKKAFKSKALDKLRSRNFPKNDIDISVGNEAHAAMKKCYCFGHSVSESDTLYLNQIQVECIQTRQSVSESDIYSVSESDTPKASKSNDNKASQNPQDNRSQDNNNYDHIDHKVSIVKEAMTQKWNGQLKELPPEVHIKAAIGKHGDKAILEAIDRMPLTPKKLDPQTLMNYIGKVIEHPAWYISKEGKAVSKQDKVLQLRKEILSLEETISEWERESIEAISPEKGAGIPTDREAYRTWQINDLKRQIRNREMKLAEWAL